MRSPFPGSYLQTKGHCDKKRQGHEVRAPANEIGSSCQVQAVAFAAPTNASTMEWKMTSPSAESNAAAPARPVGGINPATLRSRLKIPEMLAVEPLGFPAVSSVPCGVV